MDMLVHLLKNDFGLTVEHEDILAMLDKNKNGEIDFDEFKTLLA